MLSKLSLAAGAASAVTDFTPNSKACSNYGSWYSTMDEYLDSLNKNVSLVFSMLVGEVSDPVELCYKVCIHAGDDAKHGCCTYDGQKKECTLEEAKSSTSFGSPLQTADSTYSAYAWAAGQKPAATNLAALDP